MTDRTVRFRDAITDLVPYEPGKPAEELMRERGLDRCIKLASNEGPWGPVPAAADAIIAATSSLNRYPDGAGVLVREAIAAHHGVTPQEVVLGHGADAIINNLSLAMLEPGDEVVFGWPSFPSYFLDAKMMGAVSVMVPLDAAHTYDLDAMLEAITDRTRIVYVCNPNNPTGTMVARDQLASFLAAVPKHVLVVIDEAYFEYVQRTDYPDGIVDGYAAGHNVLVLRTFSKIYGLAGLRIGYAIAHPDIALAINKVRNAFDVTAPAQAAAIASLGAQDVIRERAVANNAGRIELTNAFREMGLRPVESVTNFVCVELDTPGRELYEELLGHGIIVRPLDPFGMPQAIRVTVGTPEENAAAIAAFHTVLDAVVAT
jgi:histidinol-phosphate aminotransferase